MPVHPSSHWHDVAFAALGGRRSLPDGWSEPHTISNLVFKPFYVAKLIVRGLLQPFSSNPFGHEQRPEPVRHSPKLRHLLSARLQLKQTGQVVAMILLLQKASSMRLPEAYFLYPRRAKSPRLDSSQRPESGSGSQSLGKK